MRRLRMPIAAICLLGALAPAIADQLPLVTVWKSPSCGCCGNWVAHMEDAGFSVKVENTEELDSVKKLAGIPDELQSCHTATVGGYKIEGHVPAADIKRLLTERPTVNGLSVPGMPSGSPGMENGERDPYDVLAFTRDGKTTVFSTHK
ncbi:MAG: DUF411 domain-containing protein [Hyphomicrobiales bacterium]|nr:DUF411 domain-containing protein [Hyphomicrobiales bacterium]